MLQALMETIRLFEPVCWVGSLHDDLEKDPPSPLIHVEHFLVLVDHALVEHLLELIERETADHLLIEHNRYHKLFKPEACLDAYVLDSLRL